MNGRDRAGDAALTFLTVTTSDQALLTSWFDGDVEGMAHLGFYRDVRAWIGLLSEGRRGWIAHADGRPIGFVDLEAGGTAAHFSYYVAPVFRGRGLGTALLLSIGPLCREMGLRHAVGHVDPGNQGSLAALRRAGFTVSAHLDDDGMVTASRQFPRDE